MLFIIFSETFFEFIRIKVRNITKINKIMDNETFTGNFLFIALGISYAIVFVLALYSASSYKRRYYKHLRRNIYK